MTTATVEAPTRNRVQADSVMLYLSIGRLRTRRRIETGAVQSDIDPDYLHVSKDILEAPELEAIAQYDNGLRSRIRSRCVPSPFSKKGILMLPVRLISDVLSLVDVAQRIDRPPLIEKFMGAYVQRKEEARPKLGSGFNEADYPAEEDVRKAFTMVCHVWELSAPGALRAFDQALFNRESIKMDNMFAEAGRNVTAVLMTEFRKLTGHLSERFETGADGKRKRFNDTVVSNLTEWMDLFNARNLGGDQALTEVVERAKALIQGIHPDTIRDSDALRADLSASFAELTTQLDQMIIDAPVRAIQLD